MSRSLILFLRLASTLLRKPILTADLVFVLKRPANNVNKQLDLDDTAEFERIRCLVVLHVEQSLTGAWLHRMTQFWSFWIAGQCLLLAVICNIQTGRQCGSGSFPGMTPKDQKVATNALQPCPSNACICEQRTESMPLNNLDTMQRPAKQCCIVGTDDPSWSLVQGGLPILRSKHLSLPSGMWLTQMTLAFSTPFCIDT